VKQFTILHFRLSIGIINEETFLSHLVRLALYDLFSRPGAAAHKRSKIGWLGARSFGSDERQRSGAELFFTEFSKLGYFDDKNITIEYRYAVDQFEDAFNHKNAKQMA
jgi:hypothetical protein